MAKQESKPKPKRYKSVFVWNSKKNGGSVQQVEIK